MTAWEDTSSHAQSATDRTPTSWEVRVGRARITVHRHHDYGPDVWLLSTYGDLAMYRCHPLTNKGALSAQREALVLVRGRLSGLLAAVEALIDEVI